VIVGTLKDNEALRQLVTKELVGEFTPHYPRAGHYAIRMLPRTAARPPCLLVIGGDAAGTAKGVSNLVKLLAREEG
jgi:hypothetical protein